MSWNETDVKGREYFSVIIILLFKTDPESCVVCVYVYSIIQSVSKMIVDYLKQSAPHI